MERVLLATRARRGSRRSADRWIHNWGTGRFPKPFLVRLFPLAFSRVRSERKRGRAAVLERNYVETIVREAGCHVPLHAGYDDLS